MRTLILDDLLQLNMTADFQQSFSQLELAPWGMIWQVPWLECEESISFSLYPHIALLNSLKSHLMQAFTFPINSHVYSHTRISLLALKFTHQPSLASEQPSLHSVAQQLQSKSFYASPPATIRTRGNIFSVCLSGSCKCDISVIACGNFFTFGTNIYLDSRMN